MAEFTPNYNLKKPGQDDFYNIEDFNENADIIDAELKKAQDHRENTSNPHKETADQVGAINPNLLINGNFQVWQRGTSFTGIGILKYTADRWRLNASGSIETVIVSKADDGMYVSIGDAPNLALCYTFEDSEWVKIEGKTVTLSYSIDNEVKTSTFTMEQNDSYPNSLAFFVDYGDKTEFTINWVKLELGSTATDFSPRPYAEELAMCQRYCAPVKLYHIRADFISTDSIEFMLPISVPMRLYTPTLVGEITMFNFDKNVESVAGFSYIFYNDVGNSVIKVVAQKSNHNLTDAMIELDESAYFDAEIY